VIQYHLGLSKLASVAVGAARSKSWRYQDVRAFDVLALGLKSETGLSGSSDETISYVFGD
jgi:hypothetical protein